MGAIFTKRKAHKITEQDRAILQLKNQRDKLKQYQKRIESRLTADRQLAKQLLSDGKKERALLLLRKKRYQEQLLKNTDAQLDHLHRMVHDIEFAQIEIEVLEGLKVGNNALKSMNEILSIEDIESILDETRDSIAKQQEIDELISGALTEEDEIAIDEELEEIIGESLPEVPDESLQDFESNSDLIEDVSEDSLPQKLLKQKKIALPAS